MALWPPILLCRDCCQAPLQPCWAAAHRPLSCEPTSQRSPLRLRAGAAPHNFALSNLSNNRLAHSKTCFCVQLRRGSAGAGAAPHPHAARHPGLSQQPGGARGGRPAGKFTLHTIGSASTCVCHLWVQLLEVAAKFGWARLAADSREGHATGGSLLNRCRKRAFAWLPACPPANCAALCLHALSCCRCSISFAKLACAIAPLPVHRPAPTTT